MRYVKVAWDTEYPGFTVDPHPYLDELPCLAPELPPGAWTFATDPDHYRFSSPRCVKDLGLAEVRVAADKSGSLVVRFTPNPWKHEDELEIRYTGVVHFSFDYAHALDWMDKDTFLLDELLPDPAGCRHEIALTDATLTVRCRDLEAVWIAPAPSDQDGPQTPMA
ncbi:hypothetical protein ACGFRB_12170 [Streptomyces sp. NPDC048718]|uniref:hypothetical protein n=1 Tax=Streptomyces sp. NPDC048718 TaxID=3365587 RepID=UPI00371FC1C4